MEKNESSNPKNDNKNIKIIKKDNHNQNTFINTHDLSILEYYEKQITPDGNCYYRCLSYYYRGTEEYHLEFRQLISELFENNLEKFISSYPDPDILGEKEPENEEEIMNFLKKYANYIKKPKVYAGDQEIALTSYFLGININVLIMDTLGYKSLFYYQSVIPTEEVINILYMDGNHYQLLFKRSNKDEEKEKQLKKEDNLIENFIKEKKLEIQKNSNKYLNKTKIINFPKEKIITSKYINFNRPECPNKYNEIYHYLKNSDNMPERLQYDDKSKFKLIQKKRTAFRKQAKENYQIIDNRLNYKYKLGKNNYKFLNIPFINEDKYLLSNIHNNNNHPGINKMKQLILEKGYFWEGFSISVKNFINQCPICNPKHKRKKIKLPLKQIIDEGPHYRYQADIWYLDEDLKYNNNYEYCLDIIDHFSKWLSCYLLTDKTMVNVVSKIKMYILNFGKCKIFQTDNGAEFKNAELKTFLDNEGIKLIFSRPYHPQSNGAVEAVHKSVKKYLTNEYKKHKEKFNIEISLENFLIEYNNSIHSATKRKPIEIKDLDDLDEIEEINLNIIKSMSRKLKDELNVQKDDFLLLFDNIKVNKNTIQTRYKNLKKIL